MQVSRGSLGGRNVLSRGRSVWLRTSATPYTAMSAVEGHCGPWARWTAKELRGRWAWLAVGRDFSGESHMSNFGHSQRAARALQGD